MKKTEALLRLSLARFHLNPKYMGMVCLQARVILCHLTIFVAQVKNDNVTKFAHVQVVVNSTWHLKLKLNLSELACLWLASVWYIQTSGMSIMWWANIVFTCFPIAACIIYIFILVAYQVFISVIGVLPWRVLCKVDASCNVFLVVTVIILKYWMFHIIVCSLYCLIWINSRTHQHQQIGTIGEP